MRTTRGRVVSAVERTSNGKDLYGGDCVDSGLAGLASPDGYSQRYRVASSPQRARRPSVNPSGRGRCKRDWCRTARQVPLPGAGFRRSRKIGTEICLGPACCSARGCAIHRRRLAQRTTESFRFLALDSIPADFLPTTWLNTPASYGIPRRTSVVSISFA